MVTLGEGETPLVDLPRVGEWIGLPRLRGKLEGANPTGSYKDRIAAASMTLALQRGQRGWIATSSGNAGTALAAYGARAGLPGLLLVVPTIPREKLVPCLALGASVIRVEDVGTGGSATSADAMFAAAAAVAEREDLFLGVTAHAFNPEGMRGADGVGRELARERLDACYIPTGGGGLSVAVARGLRDAGSRTAVVVAQPEGCAPIADALEGRIVVPRVDRCLSAISGLQLPSPPDGHRSLDAVRCSGGWGTVADDAEILAAARALARLEGVFVEPAAAAGIAAARRDAACGRLSASAEVVVVLTATGLKDLSSVEAVAPAVRTVQNGELRDAIDDWSETLTG